MRRDAGTPNPATDARVPEDAPSTPPEHEADAPDAGTPDASVPFQQDLNPPQLTHDVIDLSGSYDVVRQSLGALRCAPPTSQPPVDVQTCFVPFHLGQAAEQGLQALGHIALVTAAGAEVHAASAGIISFVGPLDEHDEFGPARIEMRPSLHSVFTLEYVNLTQVTVQQGQAVAAGAVLGQAGPYVEPALGRISFGVRREQQVLQRICPERYGDAGWVTSLRAAREASNQAFTSIQLPSACTSEVIVCGQPPCTSPEAFVAKGGDVDLGRLIYASECASCHGAKGEGESAIELITCPSCGTAQQLAERTALDMPPEGQCFGTCATDVTAFVIFALQ